MSDLSFSPEQRNALLQLIRTELLEIFEYADARTRPVGYPGTSIGDMIVAKGQPIEYLIDAVRTRLKAGDESKS